MVQQTTLGAIHISRHTSVNIFRHLMSHIQNYPPIPNVWRHISNLNSIFFCFFNNMFIMSFYGRLIEAAMLSRTVSVAVKMASK